MRYQPFRPQFVSLQVLPGYFDTPQTLVLQANMPGAASGYSFTAQDEPTSDDYAAMRSRDNVDEYD